MPEPVCPNILFCDLVISEQNTGKNSFIGSFPGLASPQFPMVVPRFFVAATIGNVGTPSTLHVTINIRVPATGAVIASTTAQLQRAPHAPSSAPFGVDLFDLFLPFMNVIFPSPALYEAVVLLGGDEIGKRPFPVSQVGMITLPPNIPTDR